MPAELAIHPDYWRDRARMVRVKADVAKDPRTKRMLSGIAEAYERLAQQYLERRFLKVEERYMARGRTDSDGRRRKA